VPSVGPLLNSQMSRVGSVVRNLSRKSVPSFSQRFSTRLLSASRTWRRLLRKAVAVAGASARPCRPCRTCLCQRPVVRASALVTIRCRGKSRCGRRCLPGRNAGSLSRATLPAATITVGPCSGAGNTG
jgi:hypothetical protein